MVESFDVGSLPFVGDFKKFLEGAERYGSSVDDSTKYFESRVVKGLLDKAGAGVDVPNYPQFRDMNEMFLETIKGVEKVKGGYMETDVLSLKEGREHIAEVAAIKRCSREVYEKIEKPVRLKVCVTGPYTLSTLFVYREKGLFGRIGNVISQVVENNVFREKYGSLSLVSLDEPVFGLMDDPLMDRGSEGRENLRKSWESIFQKAVSKDVQTCLHLHSTADELFWEVKSLNIIETHVEAPLYQAKKTKERLESTDKFVKASVCIVDFDRLIKDRIIATSKEKMSELVINQRVAEVWKEILGGKLDPTIFLEGVKLMKERLFKILDRFGVERVPYAGPECGLRGFPTYESALECLRRASKAARNTIL